MSATVKSELSEDISALRANVARRIVGYEDVVEDLILASLANGHVLLEGVPGLAKTSLAKTFASALGLGVRRVQFTQDLLPADITGHYYYNEKNQDFEMRPGPVFTDLLIADEINRAPPKTQSALLEAMEERQVTIEGTTMPLSENFMVLATMNPVDLQGVYRLPEAQLDRFIIRSRMGYLAPEAERRMLRLKMHAAEATSAAVASDFLKRARNAVDQVHVDDDVLAYLHDICLATRRDARVALGVSPRAVERLLAVARAHAVADGRDYAIPDDVKRTAPRVLNHRIMLSVDSDLAGMTAERIIQDAIDAAPQPDARR